MIFLRFLKIRKKINSEMQLLIICDKNMRRLMGSRIIESAAYCNQILLAHLNTNSAQNASVNWITRLLLSILCRPKVILLGGGLSLPRSEAERKPVWFCRRSWWTRQSTVVNFTNILRSAIMPIYLRQKSTNLQFKYRKAAHTVSFTDLDVF